MFDAVELSGLETSGFAESCEAGHIVVTGVARMVAQLGQPVDQSAARSVRRQPSLARYAQQTSIASGAPGTDVAEAHVDVAAVAAVAADGDQ